MLYDDLMRFEQMDESSRMAVANKCKADMVYYLVIQEILKRYGTANARDMADFHPDALGCARDQMAMRASDQGLVDYDNNGHIRNLDHSRMLNLVRGSFYNSEALRAAVSTHLATNDYKDREMSDDELSDLVDVEFEKIVDLNDPNSAISSVMRSVNAFDDYSDVTGSPYAFRMHEDMVNNQADGSSVKASADRISYLLKISPLMPEMRYLQKTDVSDFGIDDATSQILMFDAQKRILSVMRSETDVYTDAEKTERNREYHRGNPLSDFDNGLLFGASDYSVNSKSITRETRTMMDESGADISSRTFEVEHQFYNTEAHAAAFRKLCAWRFAYILESYSQQQLTDADYSIINRMFEQNSTSSNTMFGSFSIDGADKVMENANAYFRYLEDTCRELKSHMRSHEFEIHLTEDRYLSENRGREMAVRLWCTGERTNDLNRARSNTARFSSVYVYTDYTPVNIDVQPALGDVMSGGRESYLITNSAVRQHGDNANWRTSSSNPYFHSRVITADMIRNMEVARDAYLADAATGRIPDDAVLRKASRRELKNIASDPSIYVNENGRVDAQKIINTIRDDMIAIKASQTALFRTDSMRMHFLNIFESFRSSEESKYRKKADGDNPDYMAAIYEESGVMDLDEDAVFTIGDAFDRRWPQNKRDDMFIDELRTDIRDMLMTRMKTELRESYGEDVNSYVVSIHLMHKYVDAVSNIICDELQTQDVSDFNALYLERMIETLGDSIIDPDVKLDAPEYAKYNGAVLVKEGMDELFGSSDREDDAGMIDKRYRQHYVFKPNMCKYVSNRFSPADYDNMLALLSYTDAADYEDDALRLNGDIYSDMQHNNVSAVFQIYNLQAYLEYRENLLEESTDAAEVSESENDPDEENGVSSYDPTFDDRMQYSAVFAKFNDIEDVAYSWLQNHDPETETFRAIYRAKHPLQTVALEKIHRSLSRYEPGYSPDRLKITDSGIIYYKNADNELVMKIGPVVDEKAYVRPYIEDDPNGDVEIERIIRDENGYPTRDPQGKALTERVRVNVRNEYVIRDGVLLNDVVFGALDTQTLNNDPNNIPNRYYGVSAQEDNYDGYGHRSSAFTQRLRYSTYHMAVLSAIDRQLSVYHMSKRKDGMSTNMPRTIAYLELNGGSLYKCYRTNTYIMADKAKSKMADAYLSEYIDGDPYRILGEHQTDEMSRRTLSKIGNIAVMQATMYHNRVVFPKIDLNQNIGLYNQMLNIQQCARGAVVGDVDRKSMRNSDSKGARVVPFAPNRYFDSTLSATAKQLGAVAFFTDAVKFDPITGALTMDALADETARCVLTSTGVESFADGSLDCRMVNYPGAQAVDRLQLSCNAIEKATNYAPDVKFAMISLGWNMEDGYIVAKRSVDKFGHFDEDGVYHPLKPWDKIGDTESGNKGVVTKIVDTDIGAGMNDAEAEIEFKTRFLNDYLHNYNVNCAGLSDQNIADFKSALEDIAGMAPLDVLDGDTLTEKINKITKEFDHMANPVRLAKDMATCRRVYSDRPDELAKKLEELQAEYDDAVENLPEKRFQMLRDTVYTALADGLIRDRVEPFYSQYKAEHKVWEVFCDNPDLDLAVTNVCVNTRSNPSLLMYIKDAAQRDMDSGIDFRNVDPDDPQGDATLVLRDEDGVKHAYGYASGRFNVYTDVNNADHKNIDYIDSSRKTGRRYGSQEMYAFQAKHASDDFIRFITYNDPTLPNRIAKLNRRMMMNGMIFNPSTPEFTAETLTDALRDDNGDALQVTSNADGISYHTPELAGFSFVDMNVLADTILKNMRGSRPASEWQAAIDDITDDLDYGKLFTLLADGNINDVTSSRLSEDMLRHMFVTSFAKYGGNFMMLPESMAHVRPTVHHIMPEKRENAYDADKNMFMNDDSVETDLFRDQDAFDDFDPYVFGFGDRPARGREYEGEAVLVRGDIRITDEESGETVERAVVPLFLSAKESLNAETETVTSYIEDRLQFDIFKTALGAALVSKMASAEYDIIDGPNANQAITSLSERLNMEYESVNSARQKSLDVGDMSKFMKKNVYATVFPNSLTCVAGGDPTIGIDQVGLSFEKAKKLGLLRYRKDLDKNELNMIKTGELPDTWENFTRIYEPIRDDDYVLINRSPGQTTGCMRAMRLCIYGPEGDGMKINPAAATIFDGDFDGDTFGVVNPFIPSDKNMSKEESQKYHLYAARAKREIERTMTMSANLVHTADYTEIKCPDGTMIENVNPLFIAGNADYAIAKHNMQEKGININAYLDDITVMANVVEQVKQIAYDYDNLKNGIILHDMFNTILEARTDQLSNLWNYVDQSGNKQMRDTFMELVELPTQISAGEKSLDETLSCIQKYEKSNLEQLTKAYREMIGYTMDDPLFIHGESELDMMQNAIRDANISKKGKAPQLNNLLIYSGLAPKCNGNSDGYIVDKNSDGDFEMMSVGDPDAKDIRMSNLNAKSDVPESKFRTQTESNIVAQSDKSDATGIGGSSAQKMQKLFARFGYGELGLRISGPITQTYLDAKQNATKCEKNLKIGKFLLNKICNFEYVYELSDEFRRQGGTICQIYNGQYTFAKTNDKEHKNDKYMTPDECVQQLDNFLEVMGQPRFSEIDKAIVKSVLQNYTEPRVRSKERSACAPGDKTRTEMLVVKPIQKADAQGDMTYAAMYGAPSDNFIALMKNMAKEGKGLWSGSYGYDGKIDTDRIRQEQAMVSQPRNVQSDIQKNIAAYAPSYSYGIKSKHVEVSHEERMAREMERRMTTQQQRDNAVTDEIGSPDITEENAPDIVSSKQASVEKRKAKMERSNMAAVMSNFSADDFLNQMKQCAPTEPAHIDPAEHDPKSPAD